MVARFFPAPLVSFSYLKIAIVGTRSAVGVSPPRPQGRDRPDILLGRASYREIAIGVVGCSNYEVFGLILPSWRDFLAKISLAE